MALKLRLRKGVWHARGTVHVRDRSGRLTTRRIERSTRTGSIKAARRIAGQIEAEYQESVLGGTTFAEAALTYMQTTGQTRFIGPLLDYFGTMPLSGINQDSVLQACKAIYPDRTPQTWNRQVFTPVASILRLASKSGHCPMPGLTRPEGHNAKPPLKVPDDAWFDSVLPHCPPNLAGLVMFLTLTGHRIGEALQVMEPECTIEQTKGGEPMKVTVPALVLDVMGEWVPGFGFSHRSNVSKALRKACKEAGAPYYRPHQLGRHAFATRLLKAGKSLQFVKVAGRWKTIKMVSERYGHLEQSEVDSEVKELGQVWGKQREMSRKTAKNV